MKEFVKALKQFDWGQPARHGGLPCFFLEEDGHFCGRAKEWDGHFRSPIHEFISLDASVQKLVDEAHSRGRVEGMGQIADEIDKFRLGGKLKSGLDLADTITKYVNDPRCSSEQADKRRLLGELENEIEGMLKQMADSIRALIQKEDVHTTGEEKR